MAKKTTFLHLTLPESCSESWDKMTPVQGGRHCQQCDKRVVDFTYFSDAELVRYFQNHQNICGQFRPDQLNRYLPIPTPTSRWQTWRATGLLLTGMFFANQLNAQQLSQIPVVIEQSVANDNKNPFHQITGKVITRTDQKPLIGVNIILNGTTIGTISNLDGSFILNIPAYIEDAEVIFSYLGFTEVSMAITKTSTTQSLAIEMEESIYDLETVEVVNSAPIAVRGGPVGMVQTVCFGDLHNSKRPHLPPFDFELSKTAAAFPNPFSDWLNIKLDLQKAGSYLLEIYNVQGKLLFAEAQTLPIGQQVIVLKNLPATLPNGAYLLKVSDGQGLNIITQQVVKVNAY